MTNFNKTAAKRSVNMTLNDDLVQAARRHTSNLSALVEHLLGAWVTQEEQRISAEQGRLDAALDTWNDFYDAHGAFADAHSTL